MSMVFFVSQTQHCHMHPVSFTKLSCFKNAFPPISISRKILKVLLFFIFFPTDLHDRINE